jgi:hypothetical protein
VVIIVMTPHSIYLSIYNIIDSFTSREEYSTDVHITHFLYPFAGGVHDGWFHSLTTVNRAVVNVGCSCCFPVCWYAILWICAQEQYSRVIM